MSGRDPCVLRLHGRGAPSVSASCLEEPWLRYVQLTLPGRFADANEDRWWETVLRIALDPVKECAGAKLRIHFEEPVREWSMDIGDSPTNNGYGGDDGTTPSCAEVYLANGILSVSSAAIGGTFEPLDRVELPHLGGRQLEIGVGDQWLSIDLSSLPAGASPIRWKLETPRTRLLFALSDPSEGNPTGAAPPNDHAIYAGFNRVIHDLHGAPSKGRTGSGVRRVEISLTR